MEIWFVAAIFGAFFAGISNFFFKVAANRGYNSEIFTLYGSIVSAISVGVIAWYLHDSLLQFNLFIVIMLLAGMIASLGGIMKVYALRHIDSTIYFPLFKLLAPSLTILFGIVLFAESFSRAEWIGMLLGLTVPLLLITKAENGRQNNLKAGLLFVVFTALTSASAATLNKFVIDSGVTVLIGLFYASFGVFLGTILTIIFKKGYRDTLRHIHTDSNPKLILYGSLRAILISVSMGFILYAYEQNGTLAIVQTVHSMYILIPIVLSIIFYSEHWNLQKIAAATLSIAALGLLG